MHMFMFVVHKCTHTYQALEQWQGERGGACAERNAEHLWELGATRVGQPCVGVGMAGYCGHGPFYPAFFFPLPPPFRPLLSLFFKRQNRPTPRAHKPRPLKLCPHGCTAYGHTGYPPTTDPPRPAAPGRACMQRTWPAVRHGNLFSPEITVKKYRMTHDGHAHTYDTYDAFKTRAAAQLATSYSYCERITAVLMKLSLGNTVDKYELPCSLALPWSGAARSAA
jgi:hypothetical protein